MSRLGFAALFLLILPAALANTYVVDIGFVTSQTVYTVNETIDLKGNLYLSNYSDNGTLLANHTGLANATINISIINANTNASATYSLNTTTGGEFYSRSAFYPTAVLIQAPGAGSYNIRAAYADPSGTSWWTQSEIQVVNQTVDRLDVSSDKVTYNAEETMVISVEAIREIGDRIAYTTNVSVNGSVRNSAKTVLSTFNCTTGASGKCTMTTTAPGSYGDYFIEINNFKAFSSFKVKRFDVNIAMKDELGKSIKHMFNAGDQASVEVGVLTNSTTETYTFDGIIKDSSGAVVKAITSTTLNYNNSYTNRFTFTLDALTFQVGTYFVDVNVTKTGDGVVSATTSFEVKTWGMLLKKKDVNSGFEYQYSTFPNRTVNMEVYPTWRGNGSVIDNINITTGMNISLIDKMNNRMSTTNASWNATCGKEGCYNFSLTMPSNAGEYYISVIVSFSGATQSVNKAVNVISASISAQSTDKDGALKDLFGANDYAYISVSAKNMTADTNLTEASIVSVAYMNGTEYAYVQVSDFNAVNTTNNNSEWAWNTTSQRFKLDTPSAGGVYTVYITAENNTAATSARLIVNPYDACMVAKNTAGQAGSGTGYYYVYQFKTSDTVYFELKVTQANNPTGRAAFLNASGNSSYGMGSACADQSGTKQVVNNATITIDEVINTQTGKRFILNSTASGCQADDTKGSYTCTLKPLTSWDGGGYGVKFRIVGQDGQSDIAYGGFEARAFYLYAWSSNWYARPTADITLNVYMYEAGNNWWGSYGSGGLSGTVKLEKVEYQGREGEWLWPPIEYNYNVSNVSTSTITNGQGTITLPANSAPGGQWKTGYYRAILKGTDNGGTSDYGYAWFSIRRWQVYASPVECSGSSCTSTYNINSKSNISLYVTINNAGEWGQSGNDLGGDIIISVKKLQDCRKWPCTDMNSTGFNSTSINVSKSSGWYWSGSINRSYIINLTPNTGSWGTGYWSAVLDVNGTETGSGWFNTIAFYVEVRPTDSTGANWKYSIKNNEPMYFKATTTKSQKGGYWYASYNTSDYLNTTIDSAVLRSWDSVTYRQVEYKYPDNFNITVVGGGTTINGSRILNVTYSNGSWPSGYYWGELTLKNAENETATGWMWFEVKPFRVQVSSNQYSIDNDVCINGTMFIYEPGWYTNTILNGTYNISSVTETVWTGFGSSVTTYTNYTPSSFNNSANFTVCPNSRKWGSGSWGNYHYLAIKVQDNQSNSENGWLWFRTVPFSISWGSVVGGTNVMKSNNTVVPVTLTKASSGANTTGNLSKIYQWRWDTRGGREDYTFSVGSCSSASGSCKVNGTASVTINAPSGGWKDGYNYLQAEWTEYDDSSSVVQDYSGIWFNGVSAYSGWFNNLDENGNWKYNFALNENLTIGVYVRDSSNNAATVNVTAVQYSTPSTSCWDEYCRTYNTATYSIVGRSDNQTNSNGTAIIKIPKPSGNWSKGYIYFKVTISGSGGTAIIKNGNVYVKDLTAPTVNITAPAVNTTVTTSSFWLNWTTSESASCYINLYNYDNHYNWYCGGWNGTNSTNATTPNPTFVESCNMTKYGFNGSSYYYSYISRDYRYWSGSTWGNAYGVTGLVTGGTTHYYQYSTSGLPTQAYAIMVWCNDEDWNYAVGYSAIRVNLSAATNLTNVTLISPVNGTTISSSNITFDYSLSGPTSNCTLYGNFTGNWSSNATGINVSSGSRSFDINLANGTYLWNVYCIDITNSTNRDWGDSNRTFTVNTAANATQNLTNVTLVSPTNSASLTNTNVTFNYSLSGAASANCTLYGNFTGNWTSNTTSNSVSAGSRNFNLNLTNGRYLWNVYCADTTNSTNTDWGDSNWTFTLSNATSNATQNLTNVTLVSPTNGASLSNSNVTFNYSFAGPSTANCSLYGNFSGNWASNMTSNSVSAGSRSFNLNLTAGNRYLWNVYCVDTTNATNTDWADANWTFIVNATSNTTNSSQMNVTLVSPANVSAINMSLVTFNYTWSGPTYANCSLYGNVTGTWALNTTQTNITSGARNFSSPWRNGRYLWNVYCVEMTNGTNRDWGDINWTFVNNNTGN